MNQDATPAWDKDDRWLVRRLNEPRPFGGPSGVIPPGAESTVVRNYYRRRLLRLERFGLVTRHGHAPASNGDTQRTLWKRTEAGDELAAAATGD